MKTHAKSFKIHDKEFSYVYISDDNTAQKLLETISKYPPTARFGIDLETDHLPQYRGHTPKRGPKAGLDPHLSRIRLFQIYLGQSSCYILDAFHVTHSIIVEIVKGRKWVAHNAVFEASHLRKFSPELDDLDIECTMLGALLIDRAERSPYEPDDEDEEAMDEDDNRIKTQGFGLHALSAAYLKFPLRKEHQLSDWGKSELSGEQLAYAAIDSVVCYMLKQILAKKLTAYGMDKIYSLTCLMIPVVAEMQGTGLPIDQNQHDLLIALWSAAEAEARKLTDVEFPGVNLNSPKQLATWLQQRHPTLVAGWPLSKSEKSLTFSRPAIAHYRYIPAIDALLKYKKVNKLLNTYGPGLREFIHPYSKRLHGEYTLGETRTGRMSSRNPNLQNLPRDKDVRKMFVAPAGCKLVVYDLNQIEIRVAAELSRDEVMLSAFRNGTDLHKLIVSEMTGIPVEQIDADKRRLGKTLNFGLQFGMGPTKLRKQLAYQLEYVMTEDESYTACNTYKSLYHGYAKWSDDQRTNAERLGYVTTPLGKRRKLSEGEVYTKAVNCPVQGGAAEVLMCALVGVYKRIRREGYKGQIRIAGAVHDEVILIAKEEVADVAASMLSSAMAAAMRYVFPMAPITNICEGGIGDDWAEAK